MHTNNHGQTKIKRPYLSLKKVKKSLPAVIFYKRTRSFILPGDRSVRLMPLLIQNAFQPSHGYYHQ